MKLWIKSEQTHFSYSHTYAYSGSAEKDEIASTEIEGASPSGQNPLRPPNHRTELPKAPPAIREEELSACAVKLYHVMGWEPAYLDILAEKAGLSAAQALQAVTELAQRDHSILFRTTLRVSAVIYNKVVAECQN